MNADDRDELNEREQEAFARASARSRFPQLAELDEDDAEGDAS